MGGWLTHWLTLHDAEPLKKLIVAHLVKNFPAFYWIRRIITMFTGARYWPMSWARWIHPTPHWFNACFNIVPPYTRLPSGHFPSWFSTKIGRLSIYHLSHLCYMPRPSHPPWSDHPNTLGEGYILCWHFSKLTQPLLLRPFGPRTDVRSESYQVSRFMIHYFLIGMGHPFTRRWRGIWEWLQWTGSWAAKSV